MTDDEFVRLFQRRAADAGHDIGLANGIAGKRTVAALDKVPPPLVLISEPPPAGDGDAIPDAGEARLMGVHNARSV